MNGTAVSVRRSPRVTLLVGAACTVLVSTAPPAGAQSADVLVRVERTPDVQTLSQSPNWVPITVTIVDRATQLPPADDYNVVALAITSAGEETETSGCGQRSDNNLGVPRGIYDCVVIVDHGGAWTFHGVVNSVPIGSQPIVTLARGSFDAEVEAGTLAGLAPKRDAIRGRAGEVVLLQLHSLFAGVWALCVALLVAVALPVGRRTLSTGTLHRLEDHLGLMTRSAVGATALVTGTGVYLLLNQTAYETPWSVTAAEGVLQLPYGKPYFLSMAVKLAAYGLMVLSMVPLVVEARRRSHLASESGNGVVPEPTSRQERSPWAAPSRHPGTPSGTASGTATATLHAPARLPSPVRTEPERQVAPGRAAPVLARSAAVVMALGGVTILVCVTLLKYFHEFVEASRAVIR